MTELGAQPGDAITMELILSACPSIPAALAQGSLPQSEVNVLVSSAERATGLSAQTIRKFLGALTSAAGIKFLNQPRFLLPILRKRRQGMVLLGEEEDLSLQNAIHQLLGGGDPAQPLSDLERLSQAGNAYASYQLGCYYHPQDRKNKTTLGRPYYEVAAALGYGPAYGALADYDINGTKKNLRRAAELFEHPTALAGREGRQWSSNAAQLLRYRSQNLIRCRQTLFLSILTLIFSFLTAFFNVIFGVFAITAALAALASSLFSLLAAPYHSHRFAYYLILLCWLLAVAALF
ncbi:hypothetical protein H7U37_11670 [Pseudoflavonifractor phocaeensis]|uniref:hypothetical protein n=1 Tax=Pseudoflavonifractor phocaeensis TaxID=1870988 RepID=UPI001958EB91|nr:hypothetical protein [Pseudoflavonifractor phocaeensis]MBM6871319.1 hypothetical protein [Pseudoflavonifractor phocaeensis]MBM6939171.1 hypothetical protein [Pseudoflavonifractor phocaeensis]